MRTKKVKQVYQCEHCNKWYLMMVRAMTHERKCTKNPLNKAKCLDCKSFSIKDEKWICLKDGKNISRRPKYDNQKQVCTPLNKCEDYNV